MTPLQHRHQAEFLAQRVDEMVNGYAERYPVGKYAVDPKELDAMRFELLQQQVTAARATMHATLAALG